MNAQKFPASWDEARVKRLIDHYENMTEDELLAEDGSVVLLLTWVVLLTIVLLGTLGFIVATMVKVAEAPAARVAIVSVIVLPLRFKLKDGPDVWLWDTAVSLAGSVSVRDTA